MRHPFERLMLWEMVSLGLAFLFGFIALIRGSFSFMIMTLFLLIISLVCNGMLLLYTNRSPLALKQILRGVLVFIIIVILFIQ
ncbi:MAG TPA: hypothetical protein VIG73_10910 [Cerasibacillus sp.]|uniref:hypothetical protein n=1 Tax=Cerasibacillus sp. TaxID=2498711 RepID=UPI002F417865